MRRFVMDSNAVDPIADLPGAYEAVRAAVDDGSIEILFPHITIDELAETSELERRRLLLLVLISLGRLVPSGGFVLDVSRLDHAKLSEDSSTLDDLRSSGGGHTRDALIGATAQTEQCTLVTRDNRLTNRAREQHIDVLLPLDFLAEVGFHAG